MIIVDMRTSISSMIGIIRSDLLHFLIPTNTVSFHVRRSCSPTVSKFWRVSGIHRVHYLIPANFSLEVLLQSIPPLHSTWSPAAAADDRCITHCQPPYPLHHQAQASHILSNRCTAAIVSCSFVQVLELESIPKVVTLIGAGYIGMEFAGMFARLGCEVHVVARQELPLAPRFDGEVRAVK